MKILKVSGVFIFGFFAFVGISQSNSPGGENNIYVGIICSILALLLFFSLFTKKKKDKPITVKDDLLPNNEISNTHKSVSTANNNYADSHSQETCADDAIYFENMISPTKLFLKWCKRNTKILPLDQYPGYMQYNWGIENPKDFHLELIKQGYLTEMSLEERVRNSKVSDLQNILRALHLPVIGQKQDLIQRILENGDFDTILYAIGNNCEYCLTDKANNFLSVCDDMLSLENAITCLSEYKRDGVPKYEILATLDSRTCEICGNQDGKTFLVSDAQIGINFPPFHHDCRCTTVPYYDDTPTEDLTRVARDPETGKTYDVPADMTYPEWKKVVDEGGDFGNWKKA